MWSKPTIQTVNWGLTHFFDSAKQLLTSPDYHTVRFYFYAVTQSGWKELASEFRAWKQANQARNAVAYIGTDHAITDANALTTMANDGIEVFLMRRYRGTYHPKTMWFLSDQHHSILSGSNNLTIDGLKNNIEFATLTEFVDPPTELLDWHNTISAASELMTEHLRRSYEREKEKFGSTRASKGVGGSFTWSKRQTPVGPSAHALAGLGNAHAGDLILEVMPRETGTEGAQVQIPMQAATIFFGLGAVAGAHRVVALQNIANGETRNLTLTRFGNSTSRLSIKELEYRSRPCVLLFRKAGTTILFEIVQRAVDPSKYRDLLRRCPQVPNRRRWLISQ